MFNIERDVYKVYTYIISARFSATLNALPLRRLACSNAQVGAVGILVVSLLWFHKIVSMVTRTKKPKADGPAGDAPQVERRATRSSSKRSEKEA